MLRSRTRSGNKRLADSWRRGMLITPTFRSTGSGIESGTGATHGSWPTGIANGDIVLCPIATNFGEPGTISTGGWTQIDWGPQNPSSGESLTIYWHRYNSGTSTLPTLNDSGDHQVSYLHAFGGCTELGNPFDTGAGSVDNTVSLSATCPSITTSVSRCLLVSFCSSTHDANVTDGTFTMTSSAATTFTRGFDRTSAINTGGGYSFYYGPLTGAGVIPGASVTLSGTSTAKAMFSLALKPKELFI